MDPVQPPAFDNEPRTDGKAIASLVCGILSLVCFWILTGIPAIILGHLSRSAIRNSMGRLKGEGMALAGLIMGYISVAALPILLIFATIAIPSLLRARQAANESAAVANLRTIGSAEITFMNQSGGYGDLQQLIAAGLLDDTFREPKAGYLFSVMLSGSSFTATANPATVNAGRFGYVNTSEGGVRYTDDPALAPPGRAGQPVP